MKGRNKDRKKGRKEGKRKEEMGKEEGKNGRKEERNHFCMHRIHPITWFIKKFQHLLTSKNLHLFGWHPLPSCFKYGRNCTNFSVLFIIFFTSSSYRSIENFVHNELGTKGSDSWPKITVLIYYLYQLAFHRKKIPSRKNFAKTMPSTAFPGLAKTPSGTSSASFIIFPN